MQHVLQTSIFDTWKIHLENTLLPSSLTTFSKYLEYYYTHVGAIFDIFYWAT